MRALFFLALMVKTSQRREGYEVLSKKQLKCIELMVTTDMTQRAISKEIDAREETISRWKKTEEFKNEFNKQMKDSINLSSSIAYQTIMKLMGAKSEMVRFYAAKDILDRAGFIHEKNNAENQQEKDVAAALRGLVDGINTQTE